MVAGLTLVHAWPPPLPETWRPNQVGPSHVLQLVLQVSHVLGDQRQSVIHAQLDQ